jgi:hypothetical protein
MKPEIIIQLPAGTHLRADIRLSDDLLAMLDKAFDDAFPDRVIDKARFVKVDDHWKLEVNYHVGCENDSQASYYADVVFGDS